MKRLLFLSALCIVLAASALAQDRTLHPRRAFRPSPHLATIGDSDDAAGLVQTPYGYMQTLQSAAIPAQSIVGVFGNYLISNNASNVLIWSDSGIMIVDAQATRNPFPGLEMFIFRLPENVHGEAWVTVVGRQTSNTVRIIVE